MATASTNPPKVYRWPGSSALHTVSWEQQKANVAARHPAAPAAAAPAAPAAAPAAASGPLAMPVDPAYDSAISAATKTRDTTLAGLTQQRTAGLAGYGYNVQEDPVTGAVTNITFDPNNPFSKAMLLKQTYDQNRLKTAQTIGSRGGLYSGAAQKAQDLVNIGQVGAEDALQKSLLSFLAQNSQARANAGSQFNTATATADAERVGRISDNPLYSPDSSTAAGASGGTSSASTSSTGTKLYSWPTDAKGKAPSHTIPYDQHKANVKNKPKVKTITTGVKTP